jgi:hypothetical protein
MTERSIVFTGTQRGMTDLQLRVVQRFIARSGRRMLNGCCIGADKQAVDAWSAVKGDLQEVEGFPANVPGKRAECLVGILHPPAPPLERNRTMVEEAIRSGNPCVLATPKTEYEEQRSGTWATVRYAWSRSVPVFLVYPDGSWEWTRSRADLSRATP